MRVLLLLASCLLARATARPSLYHGLAPATYAAVHPYALTSQYHAQDELGQYSYGYSGDTSAKHETRTLDGVTRGGYSYLDAHGLVQSVSYVSDPVNGFRVAATNLPRDPAPVPVAVAAAAAPSAVVDLPAAPLPVTETPEVRRAKAEHLAAVQRAAEAAAAAPDDSEAEVAATPAYLHAPLAPVVAATPAYLRAPVAPVVAATPAYLGAYSYALGHPGYHYRSHVPAAAATSYSSLTPLSAQYHAQDELGQYSYGYSGGPSAKHETRTLDGVTRGSYSYVDSNGVLQTVSYVADDVFGFRVVATNLPVAPAVH
ncbi:cuticle protein 19.8-like [Bacillus rossius redtenbacheri]|uniref:cuticle protein 19.8-like n=1 Tax=Bacillus rossius redtenbacheri TaxID=93214 RepID=UPI002FDD610B